MKKWSRNYDKCIRCGDTAIAHKGLGLCVTCYDKGRDRTNANSRASQSKYRRNNRQKIKESQRKYHLKKRQTLLDLMGNKCCKCGFDDKRALQIDHINGGGIKERKKYNTKDYHRIVLKSIRNNEQKYQLLCANCNWIKRYENREWGE